MAKRETSDLTDMFASVRSAYRLLFTFQQRVMEVIDFAGTELGFTYDGGYYRWTDGPPRNGSGSLDRWSWDYLGFYLYEFAFQSRGKENDKLTLSIVIMCDSGMYDGEADPLDIDKYAPEEESKTRLFFVTGKNAEPSEIEGGIDEIIEELAYSERCMSGSHNTDRGTVVYKSYELVDFVREAVAREALQDFRQVCHQAGISI